jgi:hypothetical protein
MQTSPTQTVLALPYFKARLVGSPDAKQAAMLGTLKHAVGRLEWILNGAREEISGLFTKEEFILMLNCFQGEVMNPRICQRLASTVCDDLGIEIDEYEVSPLADFIDRLRNLNTSQRAALADALEITWHSGSEGFKLLEDMNLTFK